MAVSYILTDIEGTTTSVSFVYDILFPYFRNHIWKLLDLLEDPEVIAAFEDVIDLVYEETGVLLLGNEDILDKLNEWSLEDRKITPLKTLQGKLWQQGYESGAIKGHVYPDVKPALERWSAAGIKMGVFSSGSVAAQKLIFGYSEQGDLRPYFSAYFDTKTGGKREAQTYLRIAEHIQVPPSEILFLSDVKEELEAAQASGLQTIQLVREGTVAAWDQTAKDFNEII